MSRARLAMIEGAEGPAVRPAQGLGCAATHKATCEMGGRDQRLPASLPTSRMFSPAQHRLRAFSLAQAFTPGKIGAHYSPFSLSPLQGALIGDVAELHPESMPMRPLKGTEGKRKKVFWFRIPGVNAWASEKARRQNRSPALAEQLARDNAAGVETGADGGAFRVVVPSLTTDSPTLDAKW